MTSSAANSVGVTGGADSIGATAVAASGSAATPAQTARRAIRPGTVITALTVLLVASVLISLSVGRFAVPVTDTAQILLGSFLPIDQTWTDQQGTVVLDVRLPRVLLGALVGAGLALSGAAMQAVFRNPLASAQVLGVSSGASLGGVLMILAGLGGAFLVGGAFAGGLLALVLVLLIARVTPGSPLLMVILAGTVIGAMFNAFVSMLTYVADPNGELPSIVFWLMGSLATASYAKLLLAAFPIVIAGAVIVALRWRVNLLSMGDEDAKALGADPARTRMVLLIAVALITAGAVAVTGVIGWVGLVVPHLVRMLIGVDNRYVLPASALLGASYLVLIDTLSRTITTAEIPIGILTAIIGAPFFVGLLIKNGKRMWGGND